MIADDVLKILSSKNMYAKKHFGQNFLVDKNVLKKIFEISNITKEDTVIEIGPGMGCLTEFLCLNAKKVICYEIDNDMVKILEENLGLQAEVAALRNELLHTQIAHKDEIIALYKMIHEIKSNNTCCFSVRL